MSSALIGLLGVILGAGLTTYLTTLNERHIRARAALGAGRLLASELRNVQSRLGVAVDTEKWFTIPLPTATWTALQVSVSAELPFELVDDLSKTAETVLILNRAAGLDVPERGLSGGGLPPRSLTDDEVAFLEEQRERVGWLIQELEAELSKLDVKPRPSSHDPKAMPLWRRTGLTLASHRNRAIAYVAALGLIAAATYAFIPRPNPTSESVAQALVEQLGPEFVVDCDSAGGDWVCHVAQLMTADGGPCALTPPTGTSGSHVTTQQLAASPGTALQTNLSSGRSVCQVVDEASFAASLDENAGMVQVVPQFPRSANPDGQPPAPLSGDSTPQWMLEARALSTREPPIERSRASVWMKSILLKVRYGSGPRHVGVVGSSQVGR